MSNAFGVTLDSASVRRAAVEGVPEVVIAAIYLLHEHSVDEVAPKLTPDELGHVVRLVSRCPTCYPPGTLDALKRRNPTPAPQPPSAIGSNDLTSSRRHGRIYGRTRARRFAHAQPRPPCPPTPHIRAPTEYFKGAHRLTQDDVCSRQSAVCTKYASSYSKRSYN
jgi:hypothetical protein